MSDAIGSILGNLDMLFQETDKALSEWLTERDKLAEKDRGNLQFPKLMEKMILTQNWDDDQSREADPIIRYYVRKHPDWHVTRGAKGGIMPVAEKQNKEAVKLAKEAARVAVEAAIAAKEAAKEAARAQLLASTQVTSEEPEDLEESEDLEENVAE